MAAYNDADMAYVEGLVNEHRRTQLVTNPDVDEDTIDVQETNTLRSQIRLNYFLYQAYRQVDKAMKSAIEYPLIYCNKMLTAMRQLSLMNFTHKHSQLVLVILKMKAVLRKISNIPHDGRFWNDTRDSAALLYIKWFERKEFTPSELHTANDDSIDSDDSSDDDDDDTPSQMTNDDIQRVNAASTGMFRGILLTRNRAGHPQKVLDPDYPRREFRVFGNNKLNNGDWWPYQICLIRDGAHGRTMGGISGSTANGAYSVIVSGGESAYDEDEDRGDVVMYSGSGKRTNSSGQAVRQQEMTADNKAMKKSYDENKPIRLFRTAKASGQYAPREGIRYDGLYKYVTEIPQIVLDRRAHR